MNINEEKLNEFLEHAVYDLAAGYAGVMISIGHKLGLYQAMAGAGPLRAEELAERTGCAPRYVQEWLNSQAAGAYVNYSPQDETYELTPEQAVVLAQSDSPFFIPNAWNVPASMWFDEEKTLSTFRQGTGMGWNEHHDRLFCGVAAFFRNGYRANLINHWLPALSGVVEKLQQGIRVADVGCGFGHSTVLMAKSFPNSEFYGYDPHVDSINAAWQVAQDEGVQDQVHFEVNTAKSLPDKQFGLICFFDCLHDMGDPVGAIRHAKQVLSADGSVMLVEPYAGDKLEDNINPIGRLYYSASTTLCCAHSLSEEVGMALGAQAGEKRLADIFTQAGYRYFQRATETPFNLIIQARH